MTLEELLKVVPGNTDLEIENLGNYNNDVTRTQAINIMFTKAFLVQDVVMVYPAPGDSMLNEKGKLVIKLG